MSRDLFLKRLEQGLATLPASERNDIIRDYTAHFAEAAAEGRSEHETAQALGEPEALASEYLRDRPHAGADGHMPLFVRIKRLLRMVKPISPAHFTERELPWSPTGSMSISVPCEVHWRPAPEARAVIHGDAWVIEHLRLTDQSLASRMDWPFARNRRLRLELEGPAIGQWHLLGSGALHLHDIAQKDLQLSVTGSGDIFASGTADNMVLNITGTGEIDLGTLTSKTATVTVIGMGDATVAPTEAAVLTIEGHGDIKLLSEPERLETNITGGGDIRLADGSWRR